MASQNEVERLVETYREYRRSTRVRARWSEGNRGNRAIAAERGSRVRELLEKHRLLPLAGRRIFKVGCGSGGVLMGLRSLGARPEDLYGVDLVREEIAIAHRRAPEVHWLRGNGEALAFPAGFFALAITFTVFSSMLEPGMARNLAGELRRVLEPGAALLLLWYDFRFNNPQNPRVRGIAAEGIRRLFPGWRMDLQRITLLPPRGQ